jgi:hypothetical protein
MVKSARRGRDAAHPAVEILEGRMVLSVSPHLVAAAGSPGLVPVTGWPEDQPHYYVAPQMGEVDLVLTRPAHARALTIRVSTSASYNQTLPPNVRPPRVAGNVYMVSPGPNGTIVNRGLRMTGPNPSTVPFAPLKGSYRFAAGQTSMTIPIRLNPRFIPPGGNADVEVFINDPTLWGDWGWLMNNVDLNFVASMDQIPPGVVGSSRTPGAITLTFSKPMNPATAGDVASYTVYGPNGDIFHPEPLKSAVYNPATETVTLTPAAPLTQSGYTVTTGVAGKSPTDLRGNAAILGSYNNLSV